MSIKILDINLYYKSEYIKLVNIWNLLFKDDDYFKE